MKRKKSGDSGTSQSAFLAPQTSELRAGGEREGDDRARLVEACLGQRAIATNCPRRGSLLIEGENAVASRPPFTLRRISLPRASLR
jgi:hypothetical protein